MRDDGHFSISRAPTSVHATSSETDTSSSDIDSHSSHEHKIDLDVTKTIYNVPFVAFNVTSNDRSSGDP